MGYEAQVPVMLTCASIEVRRDPPPKTTRVEWKHWE
jgi:hypothetical protein